MRFVLFVVMVMLIYVLSGIVLEFRWFLCVLFLFWIWMNCMWEDVLNLMKIELFDEDLRVNMILFVVIELS